MKKSKKINPFYAFIYGVVTALISLLPIFSPIQKWFDDHFSLYTGFHSNSSDPNEYKGSSSSGTKESSNQSGLDAASITDHSSSRDNTNKATSNSDVSLSLSAMDVVDYREGYDPFEVISGEVFDQTGKKGVFATCIRKNGARHTYS